jgi:non-heme chloroperoxidase
MSSRRTKFHQSTDNDREHAMNEMSKPALTIKGEDHWTTKDGGVKLFLFEKCAGDSAKTVGTILFVHGSSMASQPTFDLQVPGRPDSSAMDHFARRGYDCWCVDMEGYGRSTKDRDNNAPISQGAATVMRLLSIFKSCGGNVPLLVYGISSGALRAALFAERHPEMVARLALDAMVWTGEGSPTLEQRRKKLEDGLSSDLVRQIA